MTSASINDLPDAAFAYIEPGGTKDSAGKTTPRSLRHFPVHDPAHVRNALARASGSPFGDKAMAKIHSAAKKFGIHFGENSLAGDEEIRELRITSLYRDFTWPLEMRDLGSDGKWIGGYATVFMPRMSKNLGGFVERVSPQAFDDAKAGEWHDVVCRFNHDPNFVLGTTAAGTLRLKPDRMGLDYQVLPPESRGDVRELVQRGDIRHSSFAFRVHPGGDEWGVTEQNFPMRTLHSVELVDVAPVLSPGYPDATAAVRATNAALRSLANYAQTTVEEIRKLAEDDELRRLLTRSEHSSTTHSVPRPAPRTLFGAQAAALMLPKKQDPYAEEE
jgi:HK97 family phage prohead protease